MSFVNYNFSNDYLSSWAAVLRKHLLINWSLMGPQSKPNCSWKWTSGFMLIVGTGLKDITIWVEQWNNFVTITIIVTIICQQQVVCMSCGSRSPPATCRCCRHPLQFEIHLKWSPDVHFDFKMLSAYIPYPCLRLANSIWSLKFVLCEK